MLRSAWRRELGLHVDPRTIGQALVARLDLDASFAIASSEEGDGNGVGTGGERVHGANDGCVFTLAYAPSPSTSTATSTSSTDDGLLAATVGTRRQPRVTVFV